MSRGIVAGLMLLFAVLAVLGRVADHAQADHADGHLCDWNSPEPGILDGLQQGLIEGQPSAYICE